MFLLQHIQELLIPVVSLLVWPFLGIFSISYVVFPRIKAEDFLIKDLFRDVGWLEVFLKYFSRVCEGLKLDLVSQPQVLLPKHWFCQLKILDII